MENTENSKIRIWHDRSNCITEGFPQYTENFTDVQLEHMWTAREIRVEDDKHSIMTDMSEAERYGVMSTLSLFTNYEVFAGKEYWTNRFLQIVKGPEFEAMGVTFGSVELAVHKPFYQKINKVFNLDNEEFYSAFTKDPVLAERMECISNIVDHKNDLISLGGFSMVEGAILYSAFAFLRSFQANGKSKIKKTVAGNTLSAMDEGLHSMAGATVFRHLTKECLEDGIYEERYGKQEDVEAELYKLARLIREHEHLICERIFEKGEIDGVTVEDLKAFVDHRLNEVLVSLGLEPIFEVTNNNIADWFYKSITSFTMIDFFNATGAQYVRSWNEEDFVFEPEENQEGIE